MRWTTMLLAVVVVLVAAPASASPPPLPWWHSQTHKPHTYWREARLPARQLP